MATLRSCGVFGCVPDSEVVDGHSGHHHSEPISGLWVNSSIGTPSPGILITGGLGTACGIGSHPSAQVLSRLAFRCKGR
jgi:hypothetical protein